MIKIGLVGGVKEYHGISFAEIFNGYNKEEAVKREWDALYDVNLDRDARITHVWDENRKNVEEVARICKIENITAKKEDMIGEVDGVIITDDCTMQHQRRAIPFIEAGIPAFIDKPLSPDIEEAEKIVALAKKHNTPIMSCSALRYAKETEDLREGRDSIGEILTGFSICREWQGSLVFYGIHALELLYSVIGGGIESVENAGRKGEDILILKYRDGRQFIVSSYEGISPLFQVGLYGTEGSRVITAKDAGYFYAEMLRKFVEMVETGREPFPPEETLEIISTLVKGEKT